MDYLKLHCKHKKINYNHDNNYDDIQILTNYTQYISFDLFAPLTKLILPNSVKNINIELEQTNTYKNNIHCCFPQSIEYIKKLHSCCYKQNSKPVPLLNTIFILNISHNIYFKHSKFNVWLIENLNVLKNYNLKHNVKSQKQLYYATKKLREIITHDNKKYRFILRNVHILNLATHHYYLYFYLKNVHTLKIIKSNMEESYNIFDCIRTNYKILFYLNSNYINVVFTEKININKLIYVCKLHIFIKPYANMTDIINTNALYNIRNLPIKLHLIPTTWYKIR